MAIELLLFPALLAAANPVYSQAAAAPESARPVVETVHFSDLNLTTTHGQRRLRARINSAAMRVCSDSTSGTPLAQPLDLECVHKAFDNAIGQVDRKIALKGRGAAIGRK